MVERADPSALVAKRLRIDQAKIPDNSQVTGHSESELNAAL
jgi:hypothetical protein